MFTASGRYHDPTHGPKVVPSKGTALGNVERDDALLHDETRREVIR